MVRRQISTAAVLIVVDVQIILDAGLALIVQVPFVGRAFAKNHPVVMTESPTAMKQTLIAAGMTVSPVLPVVCAMWTGIVRVAAVEVADACPLGDVMTKSKRGGRPMWTVAASAVVVGSVRRAT